MSATDRLAEIRALVLSRSEWFGRGWSERALSTALASGEMLRLSRSHCILREEWVQLWPEQRLLARVTATAPFQRGAGFYCRESAAVLHGLPLHRFPGRRAQVLIPHASSTHHSRYLERHVGRTREGDLGWIHGIPCTSIDRTLIDLARFSSDETGIVCADHAIRLLFPSPRGAPMSSECAEWLQSLQERLASDGTSRGRKRGSRILSRADPGGESPLESIARLRFIELGYDVRTQVPLPAPGGGRYFADLELLGVDVLVEVDGRGKYTDEDLRGRRSIQEVLLCERRRESWTRNRVDKAILRVMAPDVATTDALRTVLREQRIPPPPFPRPRAPS